MCPEGLVKPYCGLVPVKYRPFEPTVPPPRALACQLAEQHSPETSAPLLRLHIEIFDMDPMATLPGGKVQEPQDVTDDGLVCQGDMPEKCRVCSEKRFG